MASLLGGATYMHGGTFTTGLGNQTSVIVKLISKSSGGAEGDMTGFLAQQIQSNITTSDRTVYEIGSNNYYRIQGRPSGSGTISHLVGPNTQSAWTNLSNWTGCTPVTLKIDVRPSNAKCPESRAIGGATPIYFVGGFLNSVQVGTTAGEIMATSNLGFTFMDLCDTI